MVFVRDGIQGTLGLATKYVNGTIPLSLNIEVEPTVASFFTKKSGADLRSAPLSTTRSL